MNLKELKKMIAEEYAAYKKNRLKEQGMPTSPDMGLGGPPPPPNGGPAGIGDPKISVSDDDVDAIGGGDAEATLKKVFDMLTNYFEGDKEDKPADDKPADDKKDDKPADDKGASKPANKGGDDKGGDKKEKPSKDKEEIDESFKRTRKNISRNTNSIKERKDMKVLSERFQKLANIVK